MQCVPLLLLVVLVRFSYGQLTGPNVCTRTEQVNTTSLVIGKPYVIKVCRDGMSGCSETRKHHQPILKTQHQNWTRLITECCPGYVENDHKTGCVCSESCADEITSCLFGERDYANDRCNCQPGFYGIECDKRCQNGTYGANCVANCTCQNNATCSADKGECACADGWTGTNCTEPCPAGTWGPNCTSVCRCHNKGPCHHVTGTCTCTDGFIGPNCEGCKPGHTGVNCTKGHENYWFFTVFSVLLVLAIFSIVITVVLRRKRARFTAEETAPLDPVFRDNPLYNPEKLAGGEFLHVYYEIQDKNRPNTIYDRLDYLPPDNLQQHHYFNGRPLK